MHKQSYTFEVTVNLNVRDDISPEYAAKIFQQMLTENIVTLRHNVPVVTAKK